MEYFKQSNNHKRKHDAEELDSESQKSQKSLKSQKKKKKDTKSLEELRKSILKTQQKTISRTTRRQVF